MDRAAAVTAATLKSSSLVAFLLQQWSWGLISPQFVQAVMSRAHEDIVAATEGTLDMKSVAQLARIGTGGKHSRNALRDMTKIIEVPPLNSAILRFNTPMRSQHCRLFVQDREQELLLPHAMFAVMYQQHRHVWREIFGKTPGELSSFWSDMEAAGHTNLPVASAGWQSRTVPLALHGDGTPVAGVGKAWARMMDVYTLTPVLTSGNTLDFTILLYCVFVNLLTK